MKIYILFALIAGPLFWILIQAPTPAQAQSNPDNKAWQKFRQKRGSQNPPETVPQEVCISRKDFNRLQQLASRNAQANQAERELLQQKIKEIQRIQKQFDTPLVKSFAKIGNDPKIQESGTALLAKMDTKKLLIYQGICIFLVMLLRAWALGHLKAYWQRLIAGTGITILLVFLMSFVTPYLLYGKDYLVFLKAVSRAFGSGFS